MSRRSRRRKTDAELLTKARLDWRCIVLGLALIAVTLAVFSPALGAGYIWDDDAYVYANNLLPAPDGLWRIWLEPLSTPQYYPLVHTTYWLEYRIWGLSPGGYHAVNILLHAGAAVLLWLALRRLEVPWAWLAALVFAIHPLQVESVAWITERKNVLSGLLAMASLLTYLLFLKHRDQPATRDLSEEKPQETQPATLDLSEEQAEKSQPAASQRKWLWYGAAIVFFLLALLSKTVTAMLPVVLVLLAWWKDGTIVIKPAMRTRYRLLLSGVLINFLMGAMYAWGIMLAPLEEMLNLSRSAVGMVPGIGLMCFTFGVYVHDAVVRQIPASAVAALVVLIAGAGHLLFCIWPGYTTLLLGPGVIFGTAAGIGYGVSIAYAQASCPSNQGLAVGLVVASFAASGMTLSAAAAASGISTAQVPYLFGTLAAVYLAMFPLLWMLLRAEDVRSSHDPQTPVTAPVVIGKPFLALALAFFAFCYIGLMIMSHGVAILRELGASAQLSSLAPFLLNAGYLAGALLGGIFVERSSPNFAPIFSLSVLLLGLMALNAGLPSGVWFIAILVLGVGFGSTVTMFVSLLAHRYGSANAGLLFGRLNVAYGLAGLAAPSVSGLLFDFSGSFRLPILVAGAFGALGLLALVANRASDSATASAAAEGGNAPALRDADHLETTQHRSRTQ